MLAIALASPGQADDTEIYANLRSDKQVPPNILLVVETTNDMQAGFSGGITRLRRAVIEARALIDHYDTHKENTPVRIGLMFYGSDSDTNRLKPVPGNNYGYLHGELVVPIKDINVSGHKKALTDGLMELEPPLFPRYGGYSGFNSSQICVDDADRRGLPPAPYCFPSSDARYLAHDSGSTVGALNEARKYFAGEAGYQSPIDSENQCQKNHIVVFTDGLESEGSIRPDALPQAQRAPADIGHCSETETHCLSRMTEYLANVDINPSPNFPGKQTIETSFVRFLAPDEPEVSESDERLDSAAEMGGGRHIPIPDTTQESFLRAGILNHFATPTPASPPVPIGSLVRIQRREGGATQFDDFIYFGIFRPEIRSRWLGNLKKYGLEMDGAGRITAIVDDDGNPAIKDGQFIETATSYWSLPGKIDGNNAVEGGAAARLSDYTTNTGQHSTGERRVYTWNPETETDFPFALSRIMPAGTARSNDYFVAYRRGLIRPKLGGSLSHTMIFDPDRPSDRVASCSGTPIPTYDDHDPPRRLRRGLALANWILGMDVCDEDGDDSTTDGRPIMGAVLHGKPEVVPFGGTIGDVMLVLANDGYMHMIQINPAGGDDVADRTVYEGLELASIFLGTQLVGEGLDKTYQIFENLRDRDNNPLHVLDGDIAVRIDDDNDRFIAYFGQRRGGKNLFAIDLGDPGDFDNTPPKLLWHIQGGEANTAFERLGQTWSTPRFTTIADMPVVIFGGGYDPDNLDCRTFDSSGRNCEGENSRPQRPDGNALYIVNADTGALLWRASRQAPNQGIAGASSFFRNNAMTHAFTAPLRLVDTDNDENTDIIFALDSGGLLWRFDIDNTGSHTLLSRRIDGGIVADLYDNADGEKKHHRRFYNTPDVSYTKDSNNRSRLRITIGSGYRAHPLDTGTQDRMYSLVQPISKPEKYAKKVEDCSTSTTDGCLISSELFELDKTPADDAKKLDNGWYLNLNAAAGEKVLSDPVTLLGNTFFTTYTPTTELPDPCDDPEDIDLGTTQLYIVDSATGEAALNLNKEDNGGANQSDELDKSDRSLTLEVQGIAPSPELLFDADGAQALVGTQLIETSRVRFNQTGRRILYWMQDKP